MKQNINVEAEGNELILKNKVGDYVIIPKKYRLEVQNMIKERCNGCIDKLVETLPIMSDYAEDGVLIPKPYVAVQNTTKADYAKQARLKYEIFKSNQNKPKYIPNVLPILKSDDRTDYQRKQAAEYTDAVLNPSVMQQITEVLQKPLRYLANPIQGVGDIISTSAPRSALAKDLPNTNSDIFKYRKKQLNPYISNKEKLNNTINEARNLTTTSLINIGTTELGFILPKNFVTPSLNQLFKVGSKANFAADLLQLSTTDFDKILDTDMEEIGNVILNSSSLLSKIDNFDASTVIANIKNWKNINNATKMDTYKDLFNLSQSINQQTQRK